MEELFSVAGLISFLSLALMEIVLGIDNIVFISILVSRLPEEQQQRARMIGLALALIVRIILLFAITWLIGLSEGLFTVFELEISGRDLILLGGGLFLLYKATSEIHGKLEGEEESTKDPKYSSFALVITQIILLDIVFSFDSILTAIGLVDNIWIMVAAVIIAIGVMLLAAKTISEFIDKHPTVKMLALSFLIMIGVILIVEGLHVHVPKGYIYFAIFFSLLVEFLNIKAKKKKAKPPVNLHQRYTKE